jgi:hypothetical protein
MRWQREKLITGPTRFSKDELWSADLSPITVGIIEVFSLRG